MTAPQTLGEALAPLSSLFVHGSSGTLPQTANGGALMHSYANICTLMHVLCRVMRGYPPNNASSVGGSAWKNVPKFEMEQHEPAHGPKDDISSMTSPFLPLLSFDGCERLTQIGIC